MDAQKDLFRGDSKIRYTFTKETAVGLRKYIVQANTLDTFHCNGLDIAFKVPNGFSKNYSIENFNVVDFEFKQCTNYSNKEAKIRALKAEIIENDDFVRFMNVKNEDFVLRESKNILGDAYYKSTFIFSHNQDVYAIHLGSFLEQNVRILGNSLQDFILVTP